MDKTIILKLETIRDCLPKQCFRDALQSVIDEIKGEYNNVN